MKTALLAVLIGGAVSLATADQLVVTGTPREGTFQKFENGFFEFAGAKARHLKQNAAQVTRLVLDRPLKVRYLSGASNREEEAELLGYEKRTFNFSRGGQLVSVPLASVKSVTPVLAFGNGGADGDARDGYPVPAVNLDELAQGQITPLQQAGINRFIRAKKAFDDFVAQSSALAEDMNRAKGARRNDLLNKLRERKTAEQPLRKELADAYKGLTDLFPKPAVGPLTAGEHPAE